MLETGVPSFNSWDTQNWNKRLWTVWHEQPSIFRVHGFWTMPTPRDVPNTSPFLSNHPSLRDCLQPDSQLSDRCRQYRFLDPALSPPSRPSARKKIGTQSVLQVNYICWLILLKNTLNNKNTNNTVHIYIYMQQTIYSIDIEKKKSESSILYIS